MCRFGGRIVLALRRKTWSWVWREGPKGVGGFTLELGVSERWLGTYHLERWELRSSLHRYQSINQASSSETKLSSLQVLSPHIISSPLQLQPSSPHPPSHNPYQPPTINLPK